MSTPWHIPHDPIIVIDPNGSMKVDTCIDEYSARDSAFYALSTYPLARRGISPEDIINVSPPGMSWQTWIDVATLHDSFWGYGAEPALNTVVSLLPAQFGKSIATLYGPVVITGHEAEPSPAPETWAYLTGLLDDIGQVVEGREPHNPLRRDAAWMGAITLLAPVLRSLDRTTVAVAADIISGRQPHERLHQRVREAVLLTEERIEEALTRGMEAA
jgi:hypothetical protein